MSKFFDVRLRVRSVISILLLVAFGLAIIPAPVLADDQTLAPPGIDQLAHEADDHPWIEGNEGDGASIRSGTFFFLIKLALLGMDFSSPLDCDATANAAHGLNSQNEVHENDGSDIPK